MNEVDSNKNQAYTRTLILGPNTSEQETLITTAKALASEPRLRILNYLHHHVANLSEISEALDMPLATVNLHLKQLKNANLIYTKMVSAKRGTQKLCGRLADTIILHLPRSSSERSTFSKEIRMPVGSFVDHEVSSPCGMANVEQLIGKVDDPSTFYDPNRYFAKLIWFSTSGFLEYRFPYQPEDRGVPESLSISMELCSEAAPHHLDWPSDIFLEINGVMLGTWTSPADFGGEPGKLTPKWWGEWNTQYGLLKTWRVDNIGSYLDGQFLSNVTLAALNLGQSDFVKVRVGVKPDAVNVGGMNIFGNGFGNHTQDIIMQLNY